MSATTWTLRFGNQPSPIGSNLSEYFCLVTDAEGDPVDTFYGHDAQSVFDEVALLLESEATGRFG